MKTDWHKVMLYITVICIEGSWLFALMSLLNRQIAAERLSIFGMLLILPAAFILNSLLRRWHWPGIFIGISNWLAWAVDMLLVLKIQLLDGLAWADTTWLLAVPRAIVALIYGFRPELLVLLGTGLIWWLGRRLARSQVNFTALVSQFQFGLVMMVIALLSASLLEVGLAHAVYVVITFFLFSLLGISVAHAREGTSWLSGLHQGHWSGLLLMSISLILIVGILISLVVTPDLLQLVLMALKWLWGLAMTVMTWLAGLFQGEGTMEPVPMPAIGQEPAEELKPWFTMPPVLKSVIRIGWTVMVLGVVVVALWRISSQIFEWLRRKLAGMAGAEFEPLPGAFKADFLSMLKSLLFRLLGLKRLFQRGVRANPVPPEITSVRQIYRHFLSWAAAAGFPRQATQTPHEYLYQMAAYLPDVRQDLDFITQQYVRTRYGASLSTENELHQMKQSWYNVKQHKPGDRR